MAIFEALAVAFRIGRRERATGEVENFSRKTPRICEAVLRNPLAYNEILLLTVPREGGIHLRMVSSRNSQPLEASLT